MVPSQLCRYSKGKDKEVYSKRYLDVKKCEAEVGDPFDSINTASQFGNFKHIAS